MAKGCTPFLSSGLYRRFGNLTQIVRRIARGLVAFVLITAGEEFHLALKQTFYYHYSALLFFCQCFWKYLLKVNDSF